MAQCFLQDLRIEIPDQDYNEGPPPNRTQSTPPILDEASLGSPLEDLMDTQSVDMGPRYGKKQVWRVQLM